MAFSTSVQLQPYHTFSSTPCKLPSPFLSFRFSSDSFSFPLTKHTLEPRFSPFFEVRAHPTHLDTEKEISKKTRNGKIIDRLDSRVPSVGPEDFKRAARQLVLNDKEISKKTRNPKTTDKADSGFSSVGPKDIKRVGRQLREKDSSSVVEASIDKRVIKLKDKRSQNRLGPGGRGDFSSLSKDEKSVKNVPRNGGIIRASKKADEIPKKDESCQLGPGKWQGYKHLKLGSPQIMFKVGLEMCTKKGDVMGAIRLYELAKREGISIGQYHYAILLYLCSSAATGIVQPAKSGSGSRSSTVVDLSNEGSPDLDEAGKMGKRDFGNIPENCEEGEGNNLDQLFSSSTEIGAQTAREFVQLMIGKTRHVYVPNYEIKVGEDVKNYALRRGLEIYEEMILEKVEMNEAILTSLARMAMSKGNGDMAFDLVKQMKELGINPRLRSYGPALSVFCNDGDIEKAFLVEEHMLAHGVYPEESELEALMRVSVEASKGDKVYYLLHKLRTSVRKVLPSTADLIAKWFSSSAASRVGKRKWDQRLIVKAVEKGGGGWHGQGWLGKGKWNVLRTWIGADGLCKSCGEKLVTIDLDPTETENFAESVARIAKQKEKDSSFQKFQKWLDCYGPFEAVVDAANAGLLAQRNFTLSKVDEIANGIQQKLSSKKFPLIVVHHKRVTGGKMEKGLNKRLIEKWKNANALYATPTGSNDDWYWLYAAIRFKCLLVTNDEMRDHLFQLLGNDFFPKWKERHQVRFTFPNTGPEFHMPPPYSVVIQESEKGHWHIPIASEEDSEGLRMWLCITRSQSDKGRQASVAIGEGSRFTRNKEDHASPDPATDILQKLPALKHSNHRRQKDSPRNSRNTVSSSPITNQIIMQPQIEAAEKLGGSIILKCVNSYLCN